MIGFIYASLIFLVLRFSVTLFNFLSNPKLGYYGRHYHDVVSVIVFGGRGEVAEQVRDIREEVAYEHTEIFIKHPDETLEAVLSACTGRYFLFLSDHVSVKKGMIDNLIHRSKVYGLGLLSIVPNRRFRTFRDYCLAPLADFVLINIFPLKLVSLLSHPAFSVSGQDCMFFDALAFRAYMDQDIGGRVGLPMEVMKQLKQLGYRSEILLGNKFVYQDVDAGVTIAGKSVLRIFGYNYFAVLFYLIMLIAAPVIMIFNFEPAFLLLPFGLIFLSRIMVSFLTAQNPFVNVLLHPLQMLMVTVSILKVWIDRELGNHKT